MHDKRYAKALHLLICCDAPSLPVSRSEGIFVIISRRTIVPDTINMFRLDARALRYDACVGADVGKTDLAAVSVHASFCISNRLLTYSYKIVAPYKYI